MVDTRAQVATSLLKMNLEHDLEDNNKREDGDDAGDTTLLGSLRVAETEV